jgi:sulfur carrier protein
MHILLNGEPRECAPGTSVTALLEQAGLADRRVAVEVNRRIVPRSRHADTCLDADDRVEIVQAIGGG